MKKHLIFFKKKASFFAILLLSCYFFSAKPLFFEFFSEKSTQKEENKAFLDGENLKYKISYGGTNKKRGVLLAGYAHFNLKDSITSENVPIHRIKGYGGTTKFFSLFMKVKHFYTSIITKHTLKTIESTMEIIEGNYYSKNHTLFSNKEGQECIITRRTENNTKDSENVIKTNTKLSGNDILGAFYKLRTMNHDQVIKSDSVFFSYYYNDQVFNSHFINIGEEIIETKFGKIKTIKCAPLLEKGRMFKQKYGAFIWVTADNMHIPVKLEIPILVGSVYVTLIKYENTIFDLKE